MNKRGEWGGEGWGGVGGVMGDGTEQNFGPTCIIIPKINQTGDKVRK